MLFARFRRWCHCISQFLTLRFIREDPCCAVTIVRGWRTTHVGCTCGRVFRSTETL